MKRRTKIIIAVVSIITIGAGTVAVARDGHKGGERMISRLSDRLELNDQQRSDLVMLTDELREMRELMRGGLGEDTQNLRTLISAETFDQGAALEMITARTTALQTQGPELVAAAAGFFDSLDAEQKAELDTMMQRVGKYAFKHRGHHDGERGE